VCCVCFVKIVWCVYQRGLYQHTHFYFIPQIYPKLIHYKQPGPSSIKHVGVTSSIHPHYVKNPVSRKNMSISPQYPLLTTIIVKNPSVTRIGITLKNIVMMKLSLIRIHVLLPLVC